MNNELRNYKDLKRGDFIKISGIWSEILVCNEIHISNDRSEAFPRNSNWEVESVLRPSLVVRDILDKALELGRKNHYDPIPLIGGSFTFTEIHPRKEEAKTIDTQTAVDQLKELYWFGEELLKKCKSLEQDLLALHKKLD